MTSREDMFRHASQHVAEVQAGLTESMVEAIKAGDVTDEESFSDRLHEEVDSGCTYTADCMAYVVGTDNESACVDEMGPEGCVKDGNFSWESVAYFATLADFHERNDVEEMLKAGTPED